MKSRTHQLNREYAPSGDGLFNLFGMPETDAGAENEPFFEGSPLEKLFDKTPREDADES